MTRSRDGHIFVTWDQRDQAPKIILSSQCHTSHLIYTQEALKETSDPALAVPVAQGPGHLEVTREVGNISVTHSRLPSTVLSWGARTCHLR